MTKQVLYGRRMTEYEVYCERDVLMLREPDEFCAYPQTLNIYIDESGNLDNKTANSRCYIVSMVFHEGDEDDLYSEELKLEEEFTRLGYPNHSFHTGPLIHGNDEYFGEKQEIRRKLMKYFLSFCRHINIMHREFVVDKKNLNKKDIQRRLTGEIKVFLKENSLYFSRFSEVNINYDNGQAIVSNVLTESFREALARPNFVKIRPEDSRLLQVADMTSTFRLLEIKIGEKKFSSSEIEFFEGPRKCIQSYLKPLTKYIFKIGKQCGK